VLDVRKLRSLARRAEIKEDIPERRDATSVYLEWY
jgi:hypothetical protein